MFRNFIYIKRKGKQHYEIDSIVKIQGFQILRFGLGEKFILFFFSDIPSLLNWQDQSPGLSFWEANFALNRMFDGAVSSAQYDQSYV